MTVPVHNRRVFWLFWGVLALVVLAFAAWDVVLAERLGGEGTISWSVALLTAANPFLAFVIGHVSGALVWGLAAHFWTTMPRPAWPGVENEETRRVMGIEDKPAEFQPVTGIADKNAAVERLRRLEHPRVGDLYDHYKGGDYKVIAVALKEDTLAPLVIYQDGRHADRGVWVRDLDNFTERVTQADGSTRPRFLLLRSEF
jgi:hypothetical protein